jgi:small basic protein
MWLPILGLIVGLFIGQAITFPLPSFYARYLGVGSFRSMLIGRYDSVILLSGFFFNSLMAALLVFIGDRMGIDLYYVAIFVFGVRLFNNLAEIRRHMLKKHFNVNDRPLKKEGNNV